MKKKKKVRLWGWRCFNCKRRFYFSPWDLSVVREHMQGHCNEDR